MFIHCSFDLLSQRLGGSQQLPNGWTWSCLNGFFTQESTPRMPSNIFKLCKYHTVPCTTGPSGIIFYPKPSCKQKMCRMQSALNICRHFWPPFRLSLSHRCLVLLFTFVKWPPSPLVLMVPWSPPITELMRSDWCCDWASDDHGQNQKITASAESDDLASQLCSSLISSDASVCRLCWDGTISELPSVLLLKVSAWSGLQLVDLCTCKPQPRSFGRSAPQRMAGNPLNEIADMFLETICWSRKFHRNTQEHPRKNTFDWWLSHLQQNNCWSILIIFLFHGKDAHWIWVNPPIYRRHMPIVYHDISWYPLISAHMAPLLLGNIYGCWSKFLYPGTAILRE